jgi:hypothetical protein
LILEVFFPLSNCVDDTIRLEVGLEFLLEIRRLVLWESFLPFSLFLQATHDIGRPAPSSSVGLQRSYSSDIDPVLAECEQGVLAFSLDSSSHRCRHKVNTVRLEIPHTLKSHDCFEGYPSLLVAHSEREEVFIDGKVGV